MISPCPYFNPQVFCYIFFVSPVQLRKGSDRAALVASWHQARVNPPHMPIKMDWKQPREVSRN